jgi:4-hydroxy-tetrahydrodipicolinate synthase
MNRIANLGGVIPAVLMPRDESGLPIWADFDRNVQFLFECGVPGVCVNGATGEYAGCSNEERLEAVSRARRLAGSGGMLVAAVGSMRWEETVRLALEAEDAGADALLIPAPHFFSYEQGDLVEFYRQTVAKVHVPALIYNLPAFTGGLEPQVAVDLIREVEGIAGIKDSSGRLDILEALSLDGRGAVRLVGNDSVLANALSRGLCDGTISGVAGVLPELNLALVESASGDPSGFSRLEKHLADLIEQLDVFPTPWGLKLIAGCRKLHPASFSLPLSEARQKQVADFRAWFSAWWERVQPDCERVLPARAQTNGG